MSKNIIKKYEIFLAKNQYFKTNIALESKKIIKTFGLRLAKQDGVVEGIHPPFFKNWIDKQRQIIIGKVKMIRQIQSMGARSPAILGCDPK